MIRIRLQRTGRKNRPFYRIVVCNSTSPIKGKFIEKIGFYDPFTKDCKYKQDRVDYWVSVGAKASDTVQNILDKKGKIEQKNKNKIGKRQKAKEEALAVEAEAKKNAPAEESKKETPVKESEENAPKEETPAKEPKGDASKEKTSSEKSKENAPKEEENNN